MEPLLRQLFLLVKVSPYFELKILLNNRPFLLTSFERLIILGARLTQPS